MNFEKDSKTPVWSFSLKTGSFRNGANPKASKKHAQ